MLLLGEQQEQPGGWFLTKKRGKIERLAEDQHKFQQKIAVLEEDLEELQRTRAKVGIISNPQYLLQLHECFLQHNLHNEERG